MAEVNSYNETFHRSRREGERDFVEMKAGTYIADFIRLEKGWVKPDQLAMRYARADYRAQFAGSVDALTGAFNRAYTLNYLNARIAERQQFSLVFLDIDDFGTFNKKFGHHAGDAILRDFSHLADEVLKPDDLLGRYGGEEFVLALPGVSIEEGVRQISILGSRAQRELSRMQGLTGVDQITLSAGVLEWHQGQTRDQLIKQANNLERASKEAGKNRLAYLNDKGVQVFREFGK